MVPDGSAIVATGKSEAPAKPSKYPRMVTCPGGVLGRDGNVNVAIENLRRHASPWSCRKMLTWISTDTVGTAINLIANVREHVHRVIEMNKDEKQFMATHSNSGRS